MSIPKKGSRLLHFEDGIYRWRVRDRPTYSQGLGWTGLVLAIEDSEYEHGSVLIIDFDNAHPLNWLDRSYDTIGPAEVCEWIQKALTLGWQPKIRGNQFRFTT